jgi:hypothetical protein
LTAVVAVPGSATPDEAAAITLAIEELLKRQAIARRPDGSVSSTNGASKWAAVARREALDDRV